MDQQFGNKLDPEGNAFDRPDGYSGQDDHRDREREETLRDPTGAVGREGKPEAAEGGSEPPEAGRRAFVDPVTGEVHGSGSGTGGGNSGEDYDDDPQAGSGYPRTGAKGESHVAD